ncbi:MAG: MMPL family transporter [Proteobacteria bacterium]|nr:MMPL family transporter [Pseudomonadota bacterium]MBU1714495.1 MMPL family transporter [Pseudomonadota bacterium]
MGQFKKNIELWFERFTGKIIKFRWPVLGLLVLLTAASVTQLPNLTIDMSDEGFLRENDPILQTYNDFRDQFGRDDLIVLAIESPQIFNRDFLYKLKKLHVDLADHVPHLADIISMLNARNTRGIKDGIIVEDLLENWPETDEDLAVLKERVMTNPLYQNRLISEDGTFTTIVIQTDAYGGKVITEDEALSGFDDPEPDSAAPATNDQNPAKRSYISEQERSLIVTTVNKIAAKYQADDFKINIAGSPVVTNTVKKTMRADMMLFLRLAVLMIALSLFLMFRRLSAVIYPLIVVILSLLSTLATMSILGVAIKMPTMILPSFLLAVGVGDSVHILAIFFQNFKKYRDKNKALIKAMGHSGLAIVMTSLTTAAGLASFLTAEIAPVADLGLFAAFGVMLALLYTIIFLPALLAVTPLRDKTKSVKNNQQDQPAAPGAMIHMMDWLTDFSTKRSKGILVFSFLLVVFSLIGMSRLKFSHNILSWLPPDMPVLTSTQNIDHNLKGSVTLELVLDTGRENGLYDPQTLNKMDQLAQELENGNYTIPIGKVMSVVDIIKEINRALHENKAEFYVIPKDAKLVPQEFLLFENSGSDDLEDVVDSRFQQARITIKVPWQDAMKYVPFIAEVEKLATNIFGPGVEITTTGIMALFGRIIYAGIHSAAKSYLIAFCVITVMMILLINSIRLGVACMLPNLTPIIITMGMMGWLGLQFDMFTMLIGSIAIGMAVDDTIHFVYNFRKYFSESGDAVESVRKTLHTAGRAMLTTTIVLSMGFFIFMLASMSNLFNFGLLTGITLIFALAADFLLAPALLTLIAQSSIGRAEIVNR